MTVDKLVDGFAYFFLGVAFIAQHLVKLVANGIRQQVNL